MGTFAVLLDFALELSMDDVLLAVEGSELDADVREDSCLVA